MGTCFVRLHARHFDLVRTFGMSRSVPIPRGVVHRVGNSRIQRSHTICILEGVYYCLVCGRFAARTIRKLADPCPSEGPSANGKALLRRFARGLLPDKVLPANRLVDTVEI